MTTLITAVILLGVLITAAIAVSNGNKQKKQALERIKSELADAGDLTPTQALFEAELANAAATSGSATADSATASLPTAAPPAGPASSPAPPVPPAHQVEDPQQTAARIAVLEALESDDHPTIEGATPSSAAELSDLLSDFRPPQGLVPRDASVTGGPGAHADFIAADADAAALRMNLDAEFSRLGGSTVWVDATTAVTRRGTHVATARIYDRPRLVLDAAGQPVFSDLAVDAMVVRLSAC